MEDEIKSIHGNKTFTLTKLPEGRHSVGGRWVYTIKESGNGPTIFKARFVAKGYSQRKGVDYQETYSPTANLVIIRVLMQMAVQYNLILHQMDVKTAFLHALLDFEIQ